MLIDKNRGLRLDKIMITSSIVASFISIYLILNPDLALYLKQFVLKYPENLIEKFYFRGYGFSDGLFFAYPVILGFCAGMIIMGINQKKIFVACLFPMLIAIFANARSGLVPIFVSIILVILFNFRNFINNTFFISLALLLLSGIIMTFIRGNELLNTSFEWGLTSFGIFSGEDDGNLSALLGDMLVFPQNMQDWLFGSGEFIFTDHKYTTDIGYLLRLNFGGIFYSLLFFVLIFYMFFRLLKINKYIAYLLFISLIYCHFKGDFFIVNPSSRFFFFVYSVSILNPNCFKPFWTLKTTLTLK
jgi:hypothetical protein